VVFPLPFFSTFEAWMINEHFEKGYSNDWLDYTFYIQVFGNGVVAILSGLVGYFVRNLFDSYVAPFDCAIILLVIGTLLVYKNWNENYGNTTGSINKNFLEAFHVVRQNYTVLSLGIAQSFFEGAMYTFVFMWTPTLESLFANDGITEIPHGLIFCGMMICVMIGSSIFKMLIKFIKIEELMVYVFLFACIALFTPIVEKKSGYMILAAFLFI
jgi:hypothetical protein